MAMIRVKLKRTIFTEYEPEPKCGRNKGGKSEKKKVAHFSKVILDKSPSNDIVNKSSASDSKNNASRQDELKVSPRSNLRNVLKSFDPNSIKWQPNLKKDAHQSEITQEFLQEKLLKRLINMNYSNLIILNLIFTNLTCHHVFEDILYFFSKELTFKEADKQNNIFARRYVGNKPGKISINSFSV